MARDHSRRSRFPAGPGGGPWERDGTSPPNLPVSRADLHATTLTSRCSSAQVRVGCTGRLGGPTERCSCRREGGRVEGPCSRRFDRLAAWAGGVRVLQTIEALAIVGLVRSLTFSRALPTAVTRRGGRDWLQAGEALTPVGFQDAYRRE
jgi:hypothetical protein